MMEPNSQPPAAGSSSESAQRNWFGQPPGLTILFLTEMWEVFSFVGMRTMLIYYMTRQLLIEQETASITYGIYTGCVYLTPIIGGVIADRWLGRRRAVILGGSIMAFGHFLMTFEDYFHLALATVALGNGFFLPSLPSQIAALYPATDPRRQSAYSVYYMGKNLGAFFAPLVCGTLGELVGWHWGFGAAGIGMVIGLIVYVLGAKHLPPEPQRASVQRAVAREASEERLSRRVLILGAVALSVVAFRSALEQTGNTVSLWLGQGVDRTVFADVLIPMTWFQSLNPMLVFLLTPLLIARWTSLGRAGREPTPLTKMSTGAGMVALAYLLLSIVCGISAQSDAQPSWIWPALFFVLLTVGELYILPIGLGLFGRLAPATLTATVISMWYLTSFGGNLLAGFVGSFWSRTDPSVFFGCTAAIAAFSCLCLYMLRHPSQSLEGAAMTTQQRADGSPRSQPSNA